jgi:hypothetical protein
VCSTATTRLVDRFGTKGVVAFGMGTFAAGLLWAASLGAGSTYGDLLPGLVLMGTGIGLTWAPTTESIMGSLPPAKAGVGSAVNDTVREIGGALGVAVLGSILASQYTSAVSTSTDALPADAAHVAGDSLGGAVVVSQEIGGTTGAAILDAARAAYLDGFGLALTIAAAIAAAGAAIVAVWLPARAGSPASVGEAEADGSGVAAPALVTI